MDPLIVARGYKEGVRTWLEEMSEGLLPGRFRFCKKRNLVPITGDRGQVSSCFAAKIAWHIGTWQNWSATNREGCLQFIESFQQPDGYFVDGWLMSRIEWSIRIMLAKHGKLKPLAASFVNNCSDEKTRARRAVTRQSAGVLWLLGRCPQFRLPIEHESETSVRLFVRSMDWSYPWSAGSHTGHLIAFAVMNARLQNVSPLENALMHAAFDESDRFLDLGTGTWGLAGASHEQRINGAMKMLTAYGLAGRQIQYPERLLDYTLDTASSENGCGILDRLFVIQQANKHVPDYRRTDVEKIALEALNEIGKYHQDDGGFSFSQARAQRSYYGALVSLGGKQGDLHGTLMFTWACAVVLDLLGLRNEAGWQLGIP